MTRSSPLQRLISLCNSLVPIHASESAIMTENHSMCTGVSRSDCDFIPRGTIFRQQTPPKIALTVGGTPTSFVPATQTLEDQ